MIPTMIPAMMKKIPNNKTSIGVSGVKVNPKNMTIPSTNILIDIIASLMILALPLRE